MPTRKQPTVRRRVSPRGVVTNPSAPVESTPDDPIAPEPVVSAAGGETQEESKSRGPLLLADLRSPQFGEALPTLDLVMIPIGAHEQHGPALSVSTDTLSAQVLCGLVGTLMGPSVGIAPVVPWGVSWSHMGFPGTMSLRPDTLIALIEDLVTSLHASGVERFLLVNTHGGNNAALETAAERLHAIHGVPIVAPIYAYSLIANAAIEELGDEAIGHGGGCESAVVLAIRPDLVDETQLGQRELNEPIRRVMRIVRAAGGVLPIAQHRTSTSGVSGDSRKATASAGTAILGRAAGQLQAIASEIIALDPADFRPES